MTEREEELKKFRIGAYRESLIPILTAVELGTDYAQNTILDLCHEALIKSGDPLVGKYGYSQEFLDNIACEEADKAIADFNSGRV